MVRSSLTLCLFVLLGCNLPFICRGDVSDLQKWMTAAEEKIAKSEHGDEIPEIKAYLDAVAGSGGDEKAAALMDAIEAFSDKLGIDRNTVENVVAKVAFLIVKYGPKEKKISLKLNMS